MDEPKVTNTPERIYLVMGADSLMCDVDFKELAGVTWCEDCQSDGDIEYVRADALEAANARNKSMEVDIAENDGLIDTLRDRIAELETAKTRITYLENQRRRLIDMADAIDVRHKARIAELEQNLDKTERDCADLARYGWELEAQIAAAEKQEPVAFNQWADKYGFYDTAIDVHQYARDCAKDAWDAATRTALYPAKPGDLVQCEHCQGWSVSDATPLQSEGLRKDAERYRYLTNRVVITDASAPGMTIITYVDDAIDEPNQFLDELIDAALAKQQGQ